MNNKSNDERPDKHGVSLIIKSTISPIPPTVTKTGNDKGGVGIEFKINLDI